MIHICPECGNEIPEDSEFCYICGRKKDNTLRIDDSGKVVPPGEDVCQACGNELMPDDLFCKHCKQPTQRMRGLTFKPKMRKYGWIGILLAAIPGLFGVFGLGHIYFRRWGRAALFLIITPLAMHMLYTGLPDPLFMKITYILMFGFIYVLQAAETFVLAHIPPKTAE